MKTTIIVVCLFITGCAGFDWGAAFSSLAASSRANQERQEQRAKTCTDCFGSGVRGKACTICDGTGRSYGFTCHTCRGTGMKGERCQKCDGTGRVRY